MFNINIVILDDALQHLAITPHVKILVTRYSSPFFYNSLFPIGTLRDVKSRAQNVDIILFTKSPNIIPPQILKSYSQISQEKYKIKNTFFAQYSLKVLPIDIWHHNAHTTQIISLPILNNVFILSGIANFNDFFIDALSLLTNPNIRIFKIKFRDHHLYSTKDINKIISKIKHTPGKSAIFTTEKDAIKLIMYPQIFDIPVFVIIMRFHIPNISEFISLVK